jgi:hypothetical protein
LEGPRFDRYDSDESENSDRLIQRHLTNKRYLLEWITEADFCKEFNLKELALHPFQMDDENEQQLGLQELFKIMKVMVYKIGLAYKRQDYSQQEV